MITGREIEDKALSKPTSSALENMTYKLLDWGISPDNAAYISETLQGRRSQQGVVKIFIDELQNSFDITNSTPDFLAKLIPEYIFHTLKEKMPTGELLRFYKEIESDLTQAYDNSLNTNRQNQYKIRVFNNLMLKLGPHALKHIQSLRPKNSNSWVMSAVVTAQSELPTLTLDEVEKNLKQAFRERGSLEYVDNFSDHFQIVKVLGAGTVGITALLYYKETPSSEPKELVVKMIRENVIKDFIKDNNNIKKAIDALLKEKNIVPQEAAAFQRFSLERLYKELEEINPNLENAHLVQKLYENPHITTVKSDLYLFGKANNVIFMEKAKGVELGKFLKTIRNKLATPQLSKEERDACHKQLFTLRKHYIALTQLHLKRVSQNLPVHADLHAGNIFYDADKELLSILDLGAVALPATKEAHLRLRQFLMSLYVTIGTGDIEYLRFFYKHHIEHPEFRQDQLALSEINHLLDDINDVLIKMKNYSHSHRTMNVEQGFNEIMGLISNKVLTAGISIIPKTLVDLARSNQILNEELHTIDKDLEGTPYENQVPYKERTQFSIALYSIDPSIINILYSTCRDNFFNASGLWTEESWNYFIKQCLAHPGGIEQLRFEKKFIYGIFGLKDTEAAEMDLLIPGSIISGIAALALAKVVIEKTCRAAKTQFQQLMLSYQFLSEAKKTYNDFYEHIKQSVKEKNFSNLIKFLKMQGNVDPTNAQSLHTEEKIVSKAPKPQPLKAKALIESKVMPRKFCWIKPSSSITSLKMGNMHSGKKCALLTKPSLPISQKNIFTNPTFFRRLAPVMIVGAALLYGAQKGHERFNKNKEKKSP